MPKGWQARQPWMLHQHSSMAHMNTATQLQALPSKRVLSGESQHNLQSVASVTTSTSTPPCKKTTTTPRSVQNQHRCCQFKCGCLLQQLSDMARTVTVTGPMCIRSTATLSHSAASGSSTARSSVCACKLGQGADPREGSSI